MAIPRRRLALTGGILVLLTVVGVGLVQASSDRPTIASTAAAAAPSAQPDRLRAALRLRARGLIVHGTVTIDSPKDGLITVQVDGGTISAVDATSMAIAEKGGGSVTVAIATDTRVRKDRKRATPADLKVGDIVRVVSRLNGGAATAGVIVVAPAGG